MAHKPITIVDEHNNVIGSMPMEKAWIEGVPHRLVRILVLNTEGQVLLQLRSKVMKTAPGLWDNSAAGHVDADESYETAAARELTEETGIQNVPLQLVREYYTERTEKKYTLRRFNRLYKVTVDGNTPIKPQQEEVDELRWFTDTDLQKLLQEQPSMVTSGLVESLQIASIL